MDAPADNRPAKKKRLGLKKLIYGVILVVVIAAGVSSSLYFYSKYKDLKNNPAQVSQQNAIDLKNRVAKLITVPDEVPTIATVNDASKLKSQTFFKDAQDGDKVLIFTQAKEAMIYRESTNKLINVGPISLSQNSQSQTTTP